MNFDPVAKRLIILGVVFILGGIAWQLGWINALRLGRLPGDIVIQGENSRIYFPIVTCLMLSAILSLFGWLFRR